MLIRYYIGLLLLLMFGSMEAQPTSAPPDSTQQENECTTIKIKKPKATLEISMELSVNHRPDSLSTTDQPKNQNQVAVRLPHIYDGSYGLLPVSIYEPKMDLQHLRYIIFDYVVNIQGEVVNVRIHEQNDERLKNILLKELASSRWFPAVNKNEEAIDYRTQKQVLYLSKRTLEENYDLH